MLYLTIEDIVANSMIELNKIDERKEVLIDEAKKYGEEVAKHLTKRGYFTILKLNPFQMDSFELKYRDYFNKYYEDNSFGYKLSDDKEIEDIITIFRKPLFSEALESFTNKEVIENSFSQRMLNNRENGQITTNTKESISIKAKKKIPVKR